MIYAIDISITILGANETAYLYKHVLIKMHIWLRLFDPNAGV